MKHVLGLMSDIVNNSLGKAFFVRMSRLSLFLIFCLVGVLTALCSYVGSERNLPAEVELHSCD
jgi:hypothetical protein